MGTANFPYDTQEFRSIEASLGLLWQSLTALPVEPTASLTAAADSLTLIRFLTGIELQLGQVIPLPVVFDQPTLRHLATFIYMQSNWVGSLEPRMKPAGGGSQRPMLARIRTAGSRPPLIFVPPLGGLFPATAANEALRLAALLDAGQPFYALQPPPVAPGREQIHPLRLMEIAACSAADLAEATVGGAAMLAAFCSGSHLALALAGQLVQRRVPVPRIILIDPLVPPDRVVETEESAIQSLAIFAVQELRGDWAGMDEQELLARLRTLDWNGRWKHTAWELTRRGVVPPETSPEHLATLFQLKVANERAVVEVCKASRLPAYRGETAIMQCESGAYASTDDVRRYFSRYLEGPVKFRLLAGHHATLFRPPQLAALAAAVEETAALGQSA